MPRAAGTPATRSVTPTCNASGSSLETTPRLVTTSKISLQAFDRYPRELGTPACERLDGGFLAAA
jgi:hypothetical protein